MSEEEQDDIDSETDGTASLHSDTTFDDADDEEDVVAQPGSGMANVMARLLSKKVSSKNGPILCKALTERQLVARKKRKIDSVEDDFIKVEKNTEDKSTKHATVKTEEVDHDVKPDIKSDSYSEQLLKKRQWEEMGRIRPSLFNQEAERNLQRIAAKGVVQLFNAVKKQQSSLDDNKKTSIPISKIKGQFLDMLQPQGNKKLKPEIKKEVKEDEAMWSILRDDFMMGASMKDWDKDTDS